MIERVEHLGVEAEGYTLVELESLGDVDVRIREVRPSNGVSSRISKLTVGKGVSTCAGPRRWVDDGLECVGIDPLPRTSYG